MLGALTIDVVSDVVCPWCYIGKRRLEEALTQLREVEPIRPTSRWVKPSVLAATVLSLLALVGTLLYLRRHD